MTQETERLPGIYVTLNYEKYGQRKRKQATPKIVLGTIYESSLHQLLLSSYYHLHVSGNTHLGQSYRKILMDYGYKLPPHQQLEKGDCWGVFLELNKEHVMTTPPMYSIVRK